MSRDLIKNNGKKSRERQQRELIAMQMIISTSIKKTGKGLVLTKRIFRKGEKVLSINGGRPDKCGIRIIIIILIAKII